MTQNTVWFKIDAIQGRAHNLTFWRVAYWCGKFQPRVDEVLRVPLACAHLYVTEYDGDIIACVLKTWRKSSWTRARYVFLAAHSKLAVRLFEEIQLAGPYKYRPAQCAPSFLYTKTVCSLISNFPAQYNMSIFQSGHAGTNENSAYYKHITRHERCCVDKFQLSQCLSIWAIWISV